MRAEKNSLRYLVKAVLACIVLMLAGSAKSQGMREIHPPKIRLEHGVVTGARWATPNGPELDASTDVMGRVSCFADKFIKQKTIFRVETASRYFDLSKLCGGGSSNTDFWPDYEYLGKGEKLTFRIIKERSRRTYAYVEHGKINIWKFLVVGSGPRSEAKTAPGRGRWFHFQHGIVAAIGSVADLRSLTGPGISTSHGGHVTCNSNDIGPVHVYRIIAGPHHFNLEDVCNEEWGEYPLLKVGQQITFHVENNPGWSASKRNTVHHIAWVDRGDHVWEFSIAKGDLKSAFLRGPALSKTENKGARSNKCSGKISSPVAVYKPVPPYSEQARKAKYQGTCVLRIVVDAQGNVTNAQVVKPLGMGLDANALKTVKPWEFKPATCGGVPVSGHIDVTFHFSLF